MKEQEKAEKITEIVMRWMEVGGETQCEDWWHSAVRHVQRNVDSVCAHERGEDTDEPDVHPDRYDGAAYAHAASDIQFLLKQVLGGTYPG